MSGIHNCPFFAAAGSWNEHTVKHIYELGYGVFFFQILGNDKKIFTEASYPLH